MLAPAIRKETKEEVTQSGEYCIFDLCGDQPQSGIMFVCPHAGCGDKCHLPINRPGSRGWNWNEEKTTLSPSILRRDEERCMHHFSLIEGKWVP